MSFVAGGEEMGEGTGGGRHARRRESGAMRTVIVKVGGGRRDCMRG